MQTSTNIHTYSDKYTHIYTHTETCVYYIRQHERTHSSHTSINTLHNTHVYPSMFAVFFMHALGNRCSQHQPWLAAWPCLFLPGYEELTIPIWILFASLSWKNMQTLYPYVHLCVSSVCVLVLCNFKKLIVHVHLPSGHVCFDCVSTLRSDQQDNPGKLPVFWCTSHTSLC